MSSTLLDRIKDAAELAIKKACENTTTGNWIIDHDDLHEILSYEEYHAYYDILVDLIWRDERVLDLDESNWMLDMVVGTDFCPGAASPEEF